MTEISFTITTTREYTKKSIAEELCGIAINNDMFIFGGYVRDKYILNLDTFNDIDIVYFSDSKYRELIALIKHDRYIFFVNYRTYQNRDYTTMSNIIECVTNIKIIGKDGKRFPEGMQFGIDLVKCNGDEDSWKRTYDCDFSCNLFYLDNTGVKLRYVPKIGLKLNNIDPFTFYKNITIDKRFYIVTNNFHKSTQALRLHKRATKLINNGWKMYYHTRSPFYIGTYKNIKLVHRTVCPICLDDFSDITLITNTKCKHSFCNGCLVLLLQNSQKCPECPTCRNKFCRSLHFEEY